MKAGYLFLMVIICASNVFVHAKWEPGWWKPRNWRPRIGISDEAIEKVRPLLRDAQVTITPNLKDMWKQIDDKMTLNNVIRYGGLAALFVTTGYYGPRLAWNALEKKLLDVKPDVIDKQSHPKYGRWDRFARWWSGYKAPLIIANESLHKHLLDTEEQTKHIRDAIFAGDKTATYTNVLLFGPPGTGKSLFARALADYTDMDFLPTTAENILRSSTAFDELLAMANNSKYGAILFIDEVDVLFMDRTQLLQSASPDALAQYRLVNNILTKIGQRNNKFMIVVATNLPHVIDEAMERRFPNVIEMVLPDAATRFSLLYFYCDNELFNENTNSMTFVQSARTVLRVSFMKELAERLEGFSPANIENLIKAIKDATRNSKDGVLTVENVNNAVERALGQYKKIEENKRAREKLFGGGGAAPVVPSGA